jgi:two-component system, LytTR family, response regulator LytT
MKYAIIEDESLAVKRLSRLIQELRPRAQMMFTADTIEDAVHFFLTLPALDVVFMDIQLADGISLDIFRHCKVHAPVVFTTAYDHFAAQAFKVNSVDYLLKPIEKSELERALQRFETLFASHEPNVSSDIEQLIASIKEQRPEYRKRFLVKSGHKLVFVSMQHAAYFFSEEGTSFIVTKDGERYVVEYTLEELESQLDPTAFFRIHRSMIVSMNSIRKIEPHFNNRLLLDVDPPFDEEVAVSKHRSSEFKKWLDQ